MQYYVLLILVKVGEVSKKFDMDGIEILRISVRNEGREQRLFRNDQAPGGYFHSRFDSSTFRFGVDHLEKASVCDRMRHEYSAELREMRSIIWRTD